MVRSAEFQTSRTAGYAAKAMLQNQGYEVAKVLMRSTTKPGTIGLIAWNHLEMLFICIRSYRGRYHLQEDIDALSRLQRSGTYPGDIQYWVRDKTCWVRYRICVGGAMRLGGPDDASD
ncbi:MAG: hypothetical protein LUQ50_13535 [Methanospirillum sp.]|uniref:hypothetical protein n=1 Tax=Methanospirillum sp. TaxID=45200 RepID=UPI00236FDCDF|nr:hypothetical protein [Methanospirillum sp.]MDD1730078.1 hypothetical protein [Methanospirillum sp.]